MSEHSRQDSNDGEDEPHQCHGGQEKGSSSNSGWEESETNGTGEGEHRACSCDQGLIKGSLYANIVQHLYNVSALFLLTF